MQHDVRFERNAIVGRKAVAVVKNSKREGGQRRAVNSKITDSIRERLEAAAAANERTLSAEIEYRLVRSFLQDKIDEFDEEMSRDDATKDLVSTLGVVLGTIFRWTEKSWQDDQPSRDAVACATGVVLQMMFENEPIELPALGSHERNMLERQRLVTRAQGRMMAIGILAPRMKDKSFQAFADEMKARSGYVDPGPDEDYEDIRRHLEEISNPPDEKDTM